MAIPVELSSPGAVQARLILPAIIPVVAVRFEIADGGIVSVDEK